MNTFFYFTAVGKMAVVPRQGENMTIVRGKQKVEEVNHCLQLGLTEVHLVASEYWDLLQRYNILKKIGWSNFSFNGLDEEVEKFVTDAENYDR